MQPYPEGAVWTPDCSVFEGSLPDVVSIVVMLFKEAHFLLIAPPELLYHKTQGLCYGTNHQDPSTG
ncbi:UNVERIFIED_CONTAM: hypothetical protein FKN15_038246 [Acipenser sinensis]